MADVLTSSQPGHWIEAAYATSCTVLSGSKRKKGGEMPIDEEQGVEWFGKSRRVVSGFMWDRERREIMWADGSAINPVTVREQEEAEEERTDREAVQIAVDLFT